MPLIFSFKELRDEVIWLRTAARDLLDEEAETRLQQLEYRLVSIEASHSPATVTWESPRDEPIRTIPSEGEYEEGRKGKHTFYAEITSCWDIQPIIHKQKKKVLTNAFRVAGKA